MKKEQFEISSELETLLLSVENGKNKNDERLLANRSIIDMLSLAVEENPSLRFHQILRGLNILIESDDGEGSWDNSFKRELYLESIILCERMKDSILLRQAKKKNA